MFHLDNPDIRDLLLTGDFGIERETLRVTDDGFLAQTPHPVSAKDEHILRDFCENQVEINTSPAKTAAEAVTELEKYSNEVERILASLPEREYLWPFSNPPYIRQESEIPIAQYYGEDAWKTEYRQYLANHYGFYKMTFSGIHVNYSFGEELLKRDFELSDETDFTLYKNRVYLDLAVQVVAYGWILVAITAASPLLDSSFMEEGKIGEDLFTGMASVRCSELGYWNNFSPTLDYTDIDAYTDSIQEYLDTEWITAPSELYFPIRLKPRGVNSLASLRERGVNHIELRMYDLNPLVPAGIDVRDVAFAELLLVWLTATPRAEFPTRYQVLAVQNFKTAAHYDLKTAKIVHPDGTSQGIAEAALEILDSMSKFYEGFPEGVHQVLDFERAKFVDPQARYAVQVRQRYSDTFVQKGMERAREIQALALEE